MIDSKLITPARRSAANLCDVLEDCSPPVFENNDDARLLAWRLAKTAQLILAATDPNDPVIEPLANALVNVVKDR